MFSPFFTLPDGKALIVTFKPFRDPIRYYNFLSYIPPRVLCLVGVLGNIASVR